MKLYIRHVKMHRGDSTAIEWLVWLDDFAPSRHWRDNCMLPNGDTSIHVGMYPDWPTACKHGGIAYRAANVRWRTIPAATGFDIEVIHQR